MFVYYEDCLGLDFAINKEVRFCPYRAESFIFFRPIFRVGVYFVLLFFFNVFTFYFFNNFLYEYLCKS